MASARRGLAVSVTDEHGQRVSAGGLARWLSRVAPAGARGAVGVAVVSDGLVRALNRRYRGLDYATDVLSFPAERTRSERSHHESQSGKSRSKGAHRRIRGANPQSPIPNPYLGDVVIARGVARRQARAAGHNEPTELRVLALHGLLHLLGYDHERDHGTMARVERRLRRKGGLAGGLLDRSTLRPFDRLRVAPSEVEGRHAEGGASR